MEPSATLLGVTVVLDDRAILRNVDLEIGPGLHVIRGANGSGKTTLLRAFAGLVPLAAGTRTATESPILVSHRTALLRALTPRENLSFFNAYRGGNSAQVEEALARWGIAELANRPLERCSAGQRRRAALARLDADTNGIALIDEPFGELDDAGVELVREAIARWIAEQRVVVVATHGHHELDGMATTTITVASGAVTVA